MIRADGSRKATVRQTADQTRVFATNFFAQQAQARRNTWRILLLFWIAMVATIALTFLLLVVYSGYKAGQRWVHPWEIIACLLFTLWMVVFGYLRRREMLNQGGKSVATSLEGRLVERKTEHADERRLLNVVDEMALAARIPSPPVYLLDQENSINAFAAGYHQFDAVIGITRGAVRRLNRDELQGLVAHEFSHIFNGDMRLNMQMVCWIGGLDAISTLGYMMIQGRRSSSSGKNDGGSHLIIGLAMIVVGSFGRFLGSLLRATLSREREHLADASALQYTRNPYGIGGALWKIWKLKDKGLNAPFAHEMSHFFLSSARGQPPRSFFGSKFLETHPSLETRLQRICPELLRTGAAPPGIKPDFFERVDLPVEERPDERIDILKPQTAKLAGAVSLLQQATDQVSSFGTNLERSHHTGTHLLQLARREAALAKSLALALANIRPTSATSKDDELRAQLEAWLATVEQPEFERLQLLNLSLPALRENREDERRHWLSELEKLEIHDSTPDGRFNMLLVAYTIFALHPDRRTPLRAPATADLMLATHQILSFASQVGHESATERAKAYAAGWMLMKRNLPSLSAKPLARLRIADLVLAFRVLKATPPLTLTELHQSLDRVMEFDRRVTGREAAMVQALRTAAGAPDWPG